MLRTDECVTNSGKFAEAFGYVCALRLFFIFFKNLTFTKKRDARFNKH